MKGVGVLYHAFRKSLRENRAKIAPLQVVSRLEEYLTKEFCSVIFTKSGMNILPLTSPGLSKDGRRIDLALLEGDLSKARNLETAKRFRDKLLIRGFLEVKYLRNRHRFGYSDAQDEIRPTLKDLHRQLGQFNQAEYAGYRVHLRGRRKDIYGLVFASHAWRDDDLRAVDGPSAADDRKSFLEKIKKCAREEGLRYYDLSDPQLDVVYADETVTILKGHFRTSLYLGLWRLED